MKTIAVVAIVCLSWFDMQAQNQIKQGVPAVTLGHPDDFVRVIDVIAVILAGIIDESLALLVHNRFDRDGLLVHRGPTISLSRPVGNRPSRPSIPSRSNPGGGEDSIGMAMRANYTSLVR